jgi:hypothetical protein
MTKMVVWSDLLAKLQELTSKLANSAPNQPHAQRVASGGWVVSKRGGI